MRQPAPNRRPNGFTLIELMVVVSIAAILLALAGPSFSRFIDQQRIRNAAFDMVGDLLLARSEALTKQSVVVVTPTSAAADGWSSGWSINLVSSAGALLARRDGVPPQLRLDVQGASALADLSYGRDGRITGSDSVTVQVGYAAPAPAGVVPSCIRIDATGRARADKGACS